MKYRILIFVTIVLSLKEVSCHVWDLEQYDDNTTVKTLNDHLLIFIKTFVVLFFYILIKLVNDNSTQCSKRYFDLNHYIFHFFTKVTGHSRSVYLDQLAFRMRGIRR